MSKKYTTVRTLKDQEILKKFLDKYPAARDNDELLIALVWKKELEDNGFNSDNCTLGDFFSLLAKQDISKPETITRLRRKVQEECPEYRGTKYAKRHGHIEEVKAELGYGPRGNDTIAMPKSIKPVKQANSTNSTSTPKTKSSHTIL